MGDRPSTQCELHTLIYYLIALKNVIPKDHDKVPLEALPRKNVGGVYDVLSNLHTSS